MLEVEVERRFEDGPAIAARFATARILVLFGPSGSGKTTVLRCIAGLERPDRGRIALGGEVWFDGRVDVPPQRRRVGLVFQEYALFPHLTVAANVAYGAAAPVDDVLARFELADLASRLPRELSGGQQQRVALARAVATRPRLLLLDEPLAALDVPTRERLRGELRRQLEALRIPAVLVTHDRNEALALGDEVAVLIDGRVRQTGPVEAVFQRPADADVARLLGTETIVAGRRVSSEEGLVTVAVGSARLVGLDPGAPGDDLYVLVRAEDVTLSRADAPETSARNRLAGRVTLVTREGPLVRVTLDCGFSLVALVTRAAATELALEPGTAIVASVKAPQVRIVPRA